MIITGKVWLYNNDVNTDQIFPGKYTYSVTEQSEMAKYALEDLDPSFAKEVTKGDIIIAGKNFGCGSSREQAVIAIKEAGVSAIIAESYARIYFRNCINSGLRAIIVPGISKAVKKGEEITIDTDKGIISTSSGQFHFAPLNKQLQEILDSGGLIPYLKKKLQ